MSIQRKSPQISRREWLMLGGMLGTAALATTVLNRAQPVGVVADDSPVLRAARNEPGPEAGNPDGSVTFIVFTDYNCPACRLAHPDMLAAVEADGDTRLRFLDWPIFGEDSRAAARVAIAADAQGLYLPVHSAMMWGGRADAAAAEAALVAAGGSLEQLRSTLARDGAQIEGALSRNGVHGFALGLGGTPGHLIGRVLLRGAVNQSMFRRAIDRARKLR